MTSLLERGLDLNLIDPGDYSLLMIAAYNNQPELVELLLEHRAAVDVSNSFEATAFTFAAMFNRETFAKLLLEHGADPKRRDMQGQTAADHACSNGHTALARCSRKLQRRVRPNQLCYHKVFEQG